MTLNREQNLFRMFTANPKSLLSRLILSESSDTYYDPSYLDDILFTDKDFTYVSERDGYRHLYLYSVNGEFIRQLTSGPNDLTNYYGRDLRKNYFYYQAVDDLPYRRSLYRVDARGRTTKLSDKDGINQAVFDKHFNYYIWTWSDRNTPPVSVLCQSDNAKVISTLEDNAALRQKLSALSLPQKEFFETPAADGQKLYGWMLKPAGFDSSLRYPLVMLQYSGPDSQDVLDLFGIGWEYYLAARGIIVVSVDGRGTGGRGEQFRKQTWLKLGQYEVQDQIAAARALGTLPYVDAARIGIWGWSYGAYISLLALTEGTQYFKAGIAVAPVTDYRYYNTAYTERFMRTPQQNKENYDKTSVLQRASSLKGELLLIHGLADDNVHANQTMELIDALVQEGKQFQMQLYPNRNHSILGLSNRKHLYTRMSDFFIQTLNADK
jgi:dipeptidyl-peptidase-4